MTSPYYVAVIFAMLLFVLLEHIVKFYHVDENGEVKLNNGIWSILTLCIMLFFALNFSGEELSFIYFEF